MIVDTWRVFKVTVLVFFGVYFEIQNTMRWSEGEVVKSVELYREHECLWNMKPSYSNNQMRVGALEKVVEEMGIEGFTVADARQKLKSLRNTYNQQLQKIEKSRKSIY